MPHYDRNILLSHFRSTNERALLQMLSDRKCFLRSCWRFFSKTASVVLGQNRK